MEKAPLFLLALTSAALTFVGHKSLGAVASLESVPISARLARASLQYVGYLAKTAWPAKLAAMYSEAAVESIWPALAAAILLVVVTIGAVWGAMRGYRWLAVGWLFYLGTLLPTIGIVQAGVQVMPDRSLYLPQIGLSIVLAWGTAHVAGRWRHASKVLAGALRCF